MKKLPLSPTERYLSAFNKKLSSISAKCDANPTFGKHAREANQLCGITASALFSQCKQDGFSRVTQQRLKQDQEENFDECIETMLRQYNHLWQYELSPKGFNKHARSIAQMIYDTPGTWTGLQSKNSIGENNPSKEHFFPRQGSGTIIMNYIVTHKGIEKELLHNLVKVFSQIHKTTSWENQKLKPFQTILTFDNWESIYSKCGIDMVQIESKPILEIGDFLPNYHKYLY